MRFILILTVFSTTLWGVPFAGHAADPVPQQAVPRSALVGLARDFVSRISQGFAAADQAMGVETQEDMVARMPEGEELLFKVIISPNLTLPNPLLAKTQHGKIVLSLRDFVNVLELPVTIDPASGGASGWYIRENKPFSLDIAGRTVKTDNGAFSLSQHVTVVDTDIYVPVDEVASWFGFTINTSIAGLKLTVQTPVPLPIVEKLARGKQLVAGKGIGPARLPLMEEEQPVVDVPFVDVSTRSFYKKPGAGGETKFQNDASVITSGDFAKGTLTTQSQVNDSETLASMRVNYKRQSMEPELLGPLKARKYELGDLNTVSLPLDQRSAGEQGVLVTNAPPLRNFLNPSTTITGNTFPDWDVELYRDGQLISVQTVGPDGIYKFEDVDLFSSANNFKLVLYGPQGEVREEELYVPVDDERLSGVGSAYAMSLTRQNSQTYVRNDPEGEDDDAVHFSGLYEMPLGGKTSLSAGVETKQLNGAQEGSVQAGISTNIAQTLFNLNGAVDTKSEMAAELVARRDFGQHRFRNETNFFTDGYGVSAEDEITQIFSNQLALNGPVGIGLGARPRYNLNLNYALDSEDETQTTAGAGFNTTWNRLGFNEQLQYQASSREEDSTLDSLTAISGVLAGNRLRLGANYQIKPDPDFRSVSGSLTRNLTRDLDMHLGVSRDISTKFTEASAQLNWDAGVALLTPGITYNTDKDVTATLTTRFGLARDPQKGGVRMLSRPITGSGGLSAFVFLDKDGDGVFGEGDEPIPDAYVHSLQNGGRQKTDEDGYAFFPNLSELLRTDIVLDSYSLADPFWVPGSEGASVIPRAGHVSEIEFPVHMAGEMDGTLFLKEEGQEPQPLGGVRMRLYKADGEIQETSITGQDGYYLFGVVPPGEYLLMADSDDARIRSFIRPEPEVITIGYEGTMIYAHDIYVTPGKGDVALAMLSELPPHDPDVEALLQPGTFLLNLGDYNSRLLLGLTWYRLKLQAGGALAGAVPLMAVTASEPSVKTGRHTLRVAVPGDDLKQAMARCRLVMQSGMACGVESLPEKMKLASAE